MLRSDERLALLEVARVVELTLEGLETVNSLLDVGTGTGLFAEAFAARVPQVLGIDASASMVQQAQALVPAVQFRVGLMEALPFSEAAFDVVFMGHVLHETDDLPRTLQEARRVARRRVVALEWPYRETPMGPPLAHRLPPATVQQAALDAGFAAVEVLPLQHMVLYRLHCAPIS